MLTEFKRFFTMPLNCFHFLPQNSTNGSQISTWLFISRRPAKSVCVCSERRMKWRKGKKELQRRTTTTNFNERCSKKQQQGVSLSLETSSQITRPILTRMPAFNEIVRLHSSKCKQKKKDSHWMISLKIIIHSKSRTCARARVRVCMFKFRTKATWYSQTVRTLNKWN